jgi:hypothetical protein
MHRSSARQHRCIFRNAEAVLTVADKQISLRNGLPRTETASAIQQTTTQTHTLKYPTLLQNTLDKPPHKLIKRIITHCVRNNLSLSLTNNQVKEVKSKRSWQTTKKPDEAQNEQDEQQHTNTRHHPLILKNNSNSNTMVSRNSIVPYDDSDSDSETPPPPPPPPPAHDSLPGAPPAMVPLSPGNDDMLDYTAAQRSE